MRFLSRSNWDGCNAQSSADAIAGYCTEIAPPLHWKRTRVAPGAHCRGGGRREAGSFGMCSTWLAIFVSRPETALKLPCNCPETALQLPWKCPESALKVPWNYPETTLKLPWNCTETDLKLHWNCTETALKLHWAIAETAANQHRDGGFNLRVNGCRGRWRWHRAHPA